MFKHLIFLFQCFFRHYHLIIYNLGRKQMENKNQARKYKKIPFQSRVKLIEMVCEENMPCAAAAQRLGLSSSTAKMIIKKYKEDGKIFQKKEDRARREILQEFKNTLENTEAANQANQRPPQQSAPIFFYIPYQVYGNSIPENQIPFYCPEYYMPFQ